MSLGIAVKGPDGLVLAAESRVTLQIQTPGQPPMFNTFDNATKMFDLRGLNDFVGVVTYGLAAIGQRTAHSFLPELEAKLKQKGYSKDTSKVSRKTVRNVAEDISEFYLEQWKSAMPPNYAGPPMTLIVAGFDEDAAYGSVYVVDIPMRPTPSERTSGQEFGMTWGGQHEVVNRLLGGYDPRLLTGIQGLKLDPAIEAPILQLINSLQLQVPFNVLALQDCVDLATFFLRTTIDVQQLTVGVRGCGGPLDVATITRRNGLHYVVRKEVKLKGEYGD